MTTPPRSGTAYLVTPRSGPGPGVMVLHSWWGLRDTVRDQCDALADEGFSVVAPDLFGGVVPGTAADAEAELASRDPNHTATLLLDTVVALRSQSEDPAAPIAVIGYSMGASWALWLGTRQPDSVRRVVAYYGIQNIDFVDMVAPVLGHFAEHDELVDDNDVIEMQAHMLLLEHSVEIHRYDGTSHWFAEPDRPEFDEAAAATAMERTLAFLRD